MLLRLRCRARDNAVLVVAAIGQAHHRLDFLIPVPA